MKLEKYVLLDSSIYELVKDEDFDSYLLKLLNPGIECGFIRGGCDEDYAEFINTYDETDYKTSNDILDLVEVGDLIEHNYNVRGNAFYHIFDISERNKFFRDVEKNYDNFTQNIIAIYKKQPNGDYKRYEVCREEGK